MPPPLHKATGSRLFLRTVRGRSYTRIVGGQRELTWLIFDIGLPLIALIGYVLVCRAIHSPESFVGFILLGGAMTSFWLNVLWGMAAQLFWEKETGNLQLFIMAPAPLMGILTGMAVGGMVASTVRAAAIIIIGTLLFHVHYAIASVPGMLAIFLLTLAALYSLGMSLASLFLFFGRSVWHVVNASMEPVFLLSGTYFPISSLNFWVAAGGSLIPLTLGLDAMRQLVFSLPATFGFLGPRVEGSILAAMSVVFFLAARWSLDYTERAAIAEGRITESRA